MKLAKYLVEDGRLMLPPKAVEQSLCCGECGARLVRRDVGWVCPHALHGGIKLDGSIIEAIGSRWPGFLDRLPQEAWYCGRQVVALVTRRLRRHKANQ